MYSVKVVPVYIPFVSMSYPCPVLGCLVLFVTAALVPPQDEDPREPGRPLTASACERVHTDVWCCSARRERDVGLFNSVNASRSAGMQMRRRH